MKKTLLIASVLIAVPASFTSAFAQDNGTRAYLEAQKPAAPVAAVGPLAGNVTDEQGKIVGKISTNGEITDTSGDKLGKVTADGMVSDMKGQNLGTVASSDRLGAFSLAQKATGN
ncbi:hypothetical protein FAI40_04030 [Acetobacteraceae bacterium]|nr:hypothetical protein FAI40_04030 [Acetobacteraceae bacterium]